MKTIAFSCILSGFYFITSAQDTSKHKFGDTLMLENIEVTSIRAADKAPFTKTNINKTTIEKNNLGQDLPFILNQLPSVVVNSDAGNGIGYTGISIRGSDASRVNVTLNGIPYNDA
ncbi:MAG: TonB-dependent receptor plug domain-containing protein, partial [Ginsengibacter sp.]